MKAALLVVGCAVLTTLGVLAFGTDDEINAIRPVAPLTFALSVITLWTAWTRARGGARA